MEQQELAALTDSSRQHISGIERGKKLPSLDLLGQIADHLGCTAADLLSPLPDGFGQKTKPNDLLLKASAEALTP